MDKIIEKELSYKLGGIFFNIQDELGRFCRERQYADIFENQLRKEKINYKREFPIEIADRKSNFVDFIIENRVLVDFKAKPYVEKNDFYQMKRYLEISGLELGLLVNFRDKYLKPKRILNGKFVDSEKFVSLNRLKAFTLLEIILTMAILAILASAGFGVYYSFQVGVKVDEEANKITNILRQAQANAIAGEQGSQWGVRFIYPQTGDSYYDLFWGVDYATATTTEKNFLTTGVFFMNPAASSTLDVIFSRRSGNLANSTSTIIVGLRNEAGDIVKDISITKQGLIK